jgi:hypothetical protein
LKIESLKGFEVGSIIGQEKEKENTYYVCTSYEKTITHEVFIYLMKLGAQGTKEVESLPWPIGHSFPKGIPEPSIVSDYSQVLLS